MTEPQTKLKRFLTQRSYGSFGHFVAVLNHIILDD